MAPNQQAAAAGTSKGKQALHGTSKRPPEDEGAGDRKKQATDDLTAPLPANPPGETPPNVQPDEPYYEDMEEDEDDAGDDRSQGSFRPYSRIPLGEAKGRALPTGGLLQRQPEHGRLPPTIRILPAPPTSAAISPDVLSKLGEITLTDHKGESYKRPDFSDATEVQAALDWYNFLAANFPNHFTAWDELALDAKLRKLVLAMDRLIEDVDLPVIPLTRLQVILTAMGLDPAPSARGLTEMFTVDADNRVQTFLYQIHGITNGQEQLFKHGVLADESLAAIKAQYIGRDHDIEAVNYATHAAFYRLQCALAQHSAPRASSHHIKSFLPELITAATDYQQSTILWRVYGEARAHVATLFVGMVEERYGERTGLIPVPAGLALSQEQFTEARNEHAYAVRSVLGLTQEQAWTVATLGVFQWLSKLGRAMTDVEFIKGFLGRQSTKDDLSHDTLFIFVLKGQRYMPGPSEHIEVALPGLEHKVTVTFSKETVPMVERNLCKLNLFLNGGAAKSVAFDPYEEIQRRLEINTEDLEKLELSIQTRLAKEGITLPKDAGVKLAKGKEGYFLSCEKGTDGRQYWYLTLDKRVEYVVLRGFASLGGETVGKSGNLAHRLAGIRVLENFHGVLQMGTLSLSGKAAEFLNSRKAMLAYEAQGSYVDFPALSFASQAPPQGWRPQQEVTAAQIASITKAVAMAVKNEVAPIMQKVSLTNTAVANVAQHVLDTKEATEQTGRSVLTAVQAVAESVEDRTSRQSDNIDKLMKIIMHTNGVQPSQIAMVQPPPQVAPTVPATAPQIAIPGLEILMQQAAQAALAQQAAQFQVSPPISISVSLFSGVCMLVRPMEGDTAGIMAKGELGERICGHREETAPVSMARTAGGGDSAEHGAHERRRPRGGQRRSGGRRTSDKGRPGAVRAGGGARCAYADRNLDMALGVCDLPHRALEARRGGGDGTVTHAPARPDTARLTALEVMQALDLDSGPHHPRWVEMRDMDMRSRATRGG